MPDLDTTIADGDPNHALLHQDANIEINSLRGRMATAETDITNVEDSVATKYTKPSGGIPASDLDPAALQSNVVGSLNNPQTDAAAERPSGLTYVVWDCSTRPTNALPGDFNLQAGVVA